MDDTQVGFAIRAVRLCRGLSQAEVAAAAGVSSSQISRIEAGAFELVSLRLLRRVASVLGMWLPFVPRWHGADLAKLLDESHARLCRMVAAKLRHFGWVVIPEFTYSLSGERGSIDILAWHPASRCLLIVEVKTALVDLQDLLAALNRKLRLAPIAVRSGGWQPSAVGVVLVIPDETWARKAVRFYAPLFDATLPARTVTVRRWVESPHGSLHGIWFLLNLQDMKVARRRGGALRVRRRPKHRIDSSDEANLAKSRPLGVGGGRLARAVRAQLAGCES